MGTIKGQNLRVMVGGKCIAMATSCTIHVSAQTEDSSTKDDANDWANNEVVGLSWDASTDSLVTLTDNGSNGELPTDLLSLIINKTKVTLTFDTTTLEGETMPLLNGKYKTEYDATSEADALAYINAILS